MFLLEKYILQYLSYSFVHFNVHRDVARMIIHSDQWESALRNRTEGRRNASNKKTEEREPNAPKNGTDETSRGPDALRNKNGDGLEKQTTPFRKLIKRMPGCEAVFCGS